MTTANFKRGIQSELTSVGHNNKILAVGEDDQLHTTIVFAQPLTENTKKWLNSRFTCGISVISETSVYLNHPNESNKSK